MTDTLDRIAMVPSPKQFVLEAIANVPITYQPAMLVGPSPRKDMAEKIAKYGYQEFVALMQEVEGGEFTRPIYVLSIPEPPTEFPLFGFSGLAEPEVYEAVLSAACESLLP